MEPYMNKVTKNQLTVMSLSIPFLLSHNCEVKVKLAKLETSKFDCDIINFRVFGDQFSSAIQSNDSINDTDHFCYLKSFLCDSAKSFISGLSLLSTNYIEAIELLLV